MGRSRKTIIGVVGGSQAPAGSTTEWARVIALARETGYAVAGSDAILLTGGEPSEEGEKVHEAAMSAAVKAGGSAIGVLPRQKVVEARTDKNNRRLGRVRTRLSSFQRNFINGTTPDVVIALAGGPGTLSEVLIALDASRPVVFLCSLAVLERTQKSRVREVLVEAYGIAGQRDKVESALVRMTTLADFGTEYESVTIAMETALEAAGESHESPTHYPYALSQHQAGKAPSKDDFEDMFREVSQTARPRKKND